MPSYHVLHPEWGKSKEALIRELYEQLCRDREAGMNFDEAEMVSCRVGRGRRLCDFDIWKLAQRQAEHYARQAMVEHERRNAERSKIARGEAQ